MIRRDPLANPEPLIRRVYAYVAYRIGDGPDAEDVTSDVFERALRFRGSYDTSKGEPAAWLIGIARRAIADRAGQRAAAVEAAPGVEDDEDLRITRLDVRTAVATLDDRDRELVALRYGADLTARQIGRLLGVRTNAVEVALHRVRDRLRAELETPAAPAIASSAVRVWPASPVLGEE